MIYLYIFFFVSIRSNLGHGWKSLVNVIVIVGLVVVGKKGGIAKEEEEEEKKCCGVGDVG
jgi:hypothetical protein